MRPEAKNVRTVTSIGAGPIGGGWTAFFLARGYKVLAYLHNMNEETV
ncbi:MAG: 3-hydroxybutyryl-CoA dehydrogenase, partial [Alphaproteobacteria bacterium]|nr:3-hydroxybutyryl-CoA dehydrogenase [Alphaproteobacteria bacterium]